MVTEVERAGGKERVEGKKVIVKNDLIDVVEGVFYQYKAVDDWPEIGTEVDELKTEDSNS